MHFRRKYLHFRIKRIQKDGKKTCLLTSNFLLFLTFLPYVLEVSVGCDPPSSNSHYTQGTTYPHSSHVWTINFP